MDSTPRSAEEKAADLIDEAREDLLDSPGVDETVRLRVDRKLRQAQLALAKGD